MRGLPILVLVLLVLTPARSFAQAFVLPSASNPAGTWLRPTSVLQPRFAKFSVQVDF